MITTTPLGEDEAIESFNSLLSRVFAYPRLQRSYLDLRSLALYSLPNLKDCSETGILRKNISGFVGDHYNLCHQRGFRYDDLFVSSLDPEQGVYFLDCGVFTKFPLLAQRYVYDSESITFIGDRIQFDPQPKNL